MQGHPPIAFSLEWLSADDARLLLMDNQINRRISPARVATWAEDMLSGRWGGDVNPQPIMVGSAGRLLNGQHRLQAIIKAAETRPEIRVALYVARRVPEEAFDYMDQGQARSAAQTLAIHGFTNTNPLAAAARLVLRYERFPHLVWSGVTDVSKAEVIAFTQKHSDEVALLDGRLTALASRTALNASSLLALHWLVIRQSELSDAWEPFSTGLIDGVGLSNGDPRLTLRNRTRIPSEAWGGGQGRLGMYIKTWNAFVEGRTVKLIRFGRHELPMPTMR